MTDPLDAAERAEKTSGGYAIALACAGVLDTTITPEQTEELVRIIDGIKQAARKKALEEAQ